MKREGRTSKVSMAVFPPSKNGGPIEARRANVRMSEQLLVSAVKKRRPH